MMGRTHALSGAVAWSGGSALLGLAEVRISPGTVVVGAVVTAGFALAPDLDHPSSLVARTFGPISRLVARGVAAAAREVYAATRGPQDDPGCGSGHRTLAHTWPAALAVGAMVATACAVGGRWAVGVVMGVAVGLSLRGILPARQRTWRLPRARWGGELGAVVKAVRTLNPPPGAWVTMAAIAAGIACAWAPGRTWWWVGFPAALGCLVHDLGDACTRSGAPLLWPLSVGGRRWLMVGTPRALRWHTGGPVEQWLVLPLLAVVAVVASAAALH